MGNHRLGKNAKEAELNGKEGKTWGSFQQEISSLGVLYSARPLSLSMGKKGQPGTHFNGKYQQGMNLIFQQEITG